MAFPYFNDPVNFAYLRDDDSPCHFCGAVSHRLNGDNLYGTESIDAVCFACVEKGALVDLDISTNDVNLGLVGTTLGDSDAVESLTNTIIYRTPSLPTWQDSSWPFVDGEFPVFLKIASKPDFTDQQQFVASILADDSDDTDPDWLWSMLPDHPVNSLKEGQYDLSVYLFRTKQRFVTFWDAN